MKAVNASVLLPPPRKPLTREQHMDADNGVPHPSTRVDYYLNTLLDSHLSNPDLTPQEIAEASRSAAAAAAIAAKAARATADAKAAAAAKAVAAAKSALDLIASFPNQAILQDDASLGMKKHLSAADLFLYSKGEDLPSYLQLGEVSQGIIISNSSSSCEHRNEVPTGSRERPDPEHATSNTVDFNGLGMELGYDRPVESVGAEGAKEGIQVTRKRGRPKSKVQM